MFRKHWPEMAVILILIILIFLPRTADLALFQGHDELMRNRQSLDSFQAVVEGRWGDVYSSNFGGTNLTWAQTGYRLFHYLRLRMLGETVTLSQMAEYGPDFNPLPGALFNAALLVILYWLLRRLFGWQTAALATAMLALDPYLLSEARILRTEAAFATFITLTSVTMALYAKTGQRRFLIWAGVWLAWTVATKVSGVILGPAVLLVLIGVAVRMRPTLITTAKQIRWVIVDMFILGGVALVSIVIVWPTWWVAPVQTFIELVDFVTFWGNSPRTLDYFYLGQIVEDLPATYYLFILGYKTTPLIWLGLPAFLWSLGQVRRDSPAPESPRWGGFTFPVAGGLIVLLFALNFVIVMSLSLFKTERYMMSAVSNLNVAAAVGLVWAGQWAVTRWRLRPAWVWSGTVTLLLLAHGLFSYLHHPYYFSYYNPLLGGGRAAVFTIEVGSGEALDQAIDYLNQLPNPQEQVVVCGTNLPRCEYTGSGQKFLRRSALNPIHSDWVAADFIVTYVLQTQRGEYPPGIIEYLDHHHPAEYIVTFQGIEYARVYPAPKFDYVAASELTGVSTLLGYTLNKTGLQAGETLKVEFLLEHGGEVDGVMFAQLVDTDNYVWRQTSADLLPGFEAPTPRKGTILAGEAILETPVGMPPGRYFLKMGMRRDDGQLIGLFQLPDDDDTITVDLPNQYPDRIEPPLAVDMPVDPTLTLSGAAIDPQPVQAGQPTYLTLFWQAEADVTNDYVVNLRLLDSSGNEVAYWLGRPVRSGYATNQWRASQIVQDPWLLEIPAQVTPGDYQLSLVVFDAETREEVAETQLAVVTVAENLGGEGQ
jgi:hypothetical protein